MLVLEGIGKRYDEVRAVQNVDLNIPTGQFVGGHRPIRRRQIHPAAHDQPAG